MRFEIDGNQVKCIRPEKNNLEIISFDAHLNEVAPHVEALLNDNECYQLELWLRERQQVLKFSKGQVALSALPELIAEACLALDKEPEISENLFQKLDEGIKHLSKVISTKAKVVYGDVHDQSHEMQATEQLKVKIHAIMKDL